MSKKQITFSVPKNDYGVVAVHTSKPDLLSKLTGEQRHKAFKKWFKSDACKAIHQLLNKQLEQIK